MLRLDGPATATTLAERLGLNTGATSYHLRQLAQHGFVVDDAERGNGRERWWKAAHSSTRTTSPPREDDEAADTLDAYLQTVATIYTEQLQRAMEERPLLPQEWREASTFSDWQPPAHAAPRAGRWSTSSTEIISDVEDEDDAPARRRVTFIVQLNAYPRPGPAGREPVMTGTRRPLYGWLTAEALSLTGTRVSMIAIPLFVLAQTGSASRTGLVALAEMLPLVVFKVLGGPVIDRLGARRVGDHLRPAVGPRRRLDPAAARRRAAVRSRRSSRWSRSPERCAGPATARRTRWSRRSCRAPASRWSARPASPAPSSAPRRMLGAGLAGVLVAAVGAANALLVDAASFGVVRGRAGLGDRRAAARRGTAEVGAAEERGRG